jgi:phosphoesterase RecJ-like protein
MNSGIHDQLREKFQKAQSVLITAHIRPDGDAIGSVLGLGLALREKGKQVNIVLKDGIPVSFRHLPGADSIKRKPEGEFDLRVVLDCSDLLRTGDVMDGHDVDINIDHHITNLNFAKLNFVDAEAPATSIILAENLKKWGLSIDANIAKALLTGIVSDTIGFRTPNVTPNTLRIAADLMEYGPNLSDLYTRALVRRSVEAVKYWGAGLSSIEKRGRMVIGTLTLEDRKRVGYPGNDDADLINIMSNLDGIDVTVLFVEQLAGRVKVSWRAQPGLDISKLALSLGGGGHPAAAGVELTGTLAEVQARVIQSTLLVVDEYNNKKGNKAAL